MSMHTVILIQPDYLANDGDGYGREFYVAYIEAPYVDAAIKEAQRKA